MPASSQGSDNNKSLTSLLPTLLQTHNLTCALETPRSASTLLAQNKLSPRDFIEQHPDIERTLLQSFVEDDYDGKLHLMTLSTEEREEVIGLSFWREVDDEEMREWLDLHRVEETLERHGHDDVQQQPIRPTQQQQQQQQQRQVVSFKYDGDNKLSHSGKRTMEGIRSDSITWIRNALQSETPRIQQNRITKSIIQRQLVHAWIKIELVAIKRSHRSHHLGELLLACTLSKAYEHHDNHAILHIAGTSSKNIPATKLYTKFGFVGLPRYREGGPFGEPDGDLFVLGDIGGCLEKGAWEEMWKS
ncbi:hypothetical protein ACHAW6_008684 [Cyclotella cf. meneghiniana]